MGFPSTYLRLDPAASWLACPPSEREHQIEPGAPLFARPQLHYPCCRTGAKEPGQQWGRAKGGRSTRLVEAGPSPMSSAAGEVREPGETGRVNAAPAAARLAVVEFGLEHLGEVGEMGEPAAQWGSAGPGWSPRPPAPATCSVTGALIGHSRRAASSRRPPALRRAPMATTDGSADPAAPRRRARRAPRRRAGRGAAAARR